MLKSDKELVRVCSKVNKKYFNNNVNISYIYYSENLLKSHTCWADWKYSSGRNIIRIASVLKGVTPAYVLSYLVFHEMLHANGFLYHTREFYKEENKFLLCKKANQWLEKHIKLIYKDNHE